MGFAEFIAPLRYLYRVAPFMLQYMPGTNMMTHGLAAGDLNEAEVQRILAGKHDNYMAGGSVANHPRRYRLLNGYRAMFRLMCFLPPWGKQALIRLKLYKIFWMAPFRVFITLLDIMIAIRDKDARAYVKNYCWWFCRRFDRNYHLYWFKAKRVFPLLSKTFSLPRDGRWRRCLYRQTPLTGTEVATDLEFSPHE